MKKQAKKSKSRTKNKKTTVRKSREPENLNAIEVIQETTVLNPDMLFITELEETGEPEVISIEPELISGETEIEIE